MGKGTKIVGLLAAMSLALAGCSGDGKDGEQSPSAQPTPAGSATASTRPTPSVAPSELSSIDAITVTGNFGEKPEVKGPYPFKVATTQSKVLVPGSGAKVENDQVSVEINYSGVNARTGETFDSSFERGKPAVFPLNQVIKGFAAGLVGKQQGSRVLVAIASGDGYDPQGSPQAGIQPGDTLVFVIDILRVQLTAPAGERVAAPADMPQVGEANGVPTITIPAGMAAPGERRVAALIEGNGPALKESSVLTSQSKCVTWDGREYHSSYGLPAAQDAAAGRAHKALFNALVGQKEGSRVLVTLPGAQAYPNGNPNPSIAPNTPVACVVDLLFVQDN